jgi:pimeloyl-ACP methyl ester carboxylesterase
MNIQSRWVCAVTGLVILIAAEAAFAQDHDQEPGPTRVAVKAVAPERMPVETPLGKGMLALFASESWKKPSSTVTRAVIYVHGLHRDAKGAFRDLKRARRAAGDKTSLLISPQFVSPEDVAAYGLSADTIRWRAGSWMGGIDAEGPARINGFDAMDAILASLADRSRFPKLAHVVIAGHSAGGQFVQRYAVAGRGEAMLTQAGIAVRYVVANPSSYIYLSPERPTGKGGFGPFDASTCPTFNKWKYGMEKPPRYVGKETPADLEARYLQRDVYYLLGTLDNDPKHPELDMNCGAEAQGPHRFFRGRNYVEYLKTRHPSGFNHRVFDVPNVAHEGGRMIGSACGLAALFDKPGCSS